MGYGTKALELLEKLFKNGMSNSDNNNNLSCKKLGDIISTGYNFPKINWIGSSFGLELNLLKFWAKSNYAPIDLGIKQAITYNIIVMKFINYDAEEIFINQRSKFIEYCSYYYSNMNHELGIEILNSYKFIKSTYSKRTSKDFGFDVNPIILKYIIGNNYSKFDLYLSGVLSYDVCIYYLFIIAPKYFSQYFKVKLDVISEILLFAVGLQRKDAIEIFKFLHLSIPQGRNLIINIIKKLYLQERF
ncbi:RNA cytidine acetyltransferase 1 [Astathelohania contejeani]|uniref:RNA cytidine acetyltransferase 1 n=1 Tax=Astathelohania contejeani TaxID=164912 RepID=A0ABQ7HV93_9MICR|nr:RNA cytidine acetyltransferase 1 [Thelohania contejeani]